MKDKPFSLIDAFAETETNTPEHKLNDEIIAKLFLEQIKKSSLDMSQCVGKGLVGASVLSGRECGAVAFVQESGPFC